MKFLLLASIFSINAIVSTAQKSELLDNVIYENGKQVAYFTKHLFPGENVTGLTLYNSDKQILLTVVPRKMKAPVRELRSFYYHDLILANLKDSISIYQNDALILHVFQLINDYSLIINGTISTESFSKLQRNYDHSLLDGKIDEMVSYLNNTRNFSEQAERDRSKPVYLVNERKIMQDSMLIGYFVVFDQSIQPSSTALQATERMINPLQISQLKMWNNNLVQPEVFIDCLPDIGQRPKMLGNQLYKLSKPKGMTDANIYARRLALACCMIENYAL